MNFSNRRYYVGQECALICFWKYIFFPIKRDTWLSSRNTNRYRITMCKTSEKNIHPIPFTKSLLSTSGCSANRCMAFARCEGGWNFPDVCSGPNSPGSCACNSCVSQVAGPGLHTKISWNFKKGHAGIVSRTLLCCTQIMWMFQSASP